MSYYNYNKLLQLDSNTAHNTTSFIMHGRTQRSLNGKLKTRSLNFSLISKHICHLVLLLNVFNISKYVILVVSFSHLQSYSWYLCHSLYTLYVALVLCRCNRCQISSCGRLKPEKQFYKRAMLKATTIEMFYMWKYMFQALFVHVGVYVFNIFVWAPA